MTCEHCAGLEAQVEELRNRLHELDTYVMDRIATLPYARTEAVEKLEKRVRELEARLSRAGVVCR